MSPLFNKGVTFHWQGSWGQHGAHLGPTGPRWAPWWPHELCYLGRNWQKYVLTEYVLSSMCLSLKECKTGTVSFCHYNPTDGSIRKLSWIRFNCHIVSISYHHDRFTKLLSNTCIFHYRPWTKIPSIVRLDLCMELIAILVTMLLITAINLSSGYF